MLNSDTKEKKRKVIALVKEINRSKEDIITYLSSIGVEKVTINTSLEPDVVAKVYSHFRKDLEEQDKHIKKVVDFVQKNNIEIFEADEQIKKVEEEKYRKEEDEKLRKVIEEENKRKEEERKKQELMAYLEREKVIKEQEEQEKQKRLEEKRRKEGQRPTVKPGEESAKLRDTSDTAKSTAQTGDKKPPFEKKPFEKKPFDNKGAGERKPFEKRPFENKGTTGTGERKPFEKRPFENKGTGGTGTGERKPFEKRPFDNRGGTGTNAGTGGQAGTGQRKPFERKPFDKNKKFEKVTINDIKAQKKKPFTPDGKPETPAKPGGGLFKAPGTTFDEDAKRYLEKKEKEKKLKEQEYEKKKKNKFAKGHRVKDATQKEIDEAIRDTFAKIGEDAASSARSQARKRKKKERLEIEQKMQELADSRKNVIKVAEFLTTSELANLMNIEVTDLIKRSFGLGMMVSINQRLDKDLIVLLASELDFEIEFQDEYEEETIEETEDDPATLVERPPVVTVMGHVDHGKTSLLDNLRKANVVAGEAGGITQHIGAYTVTLDSGKRITFLDTPGHEAFTAMRARGGQAADIVILVVAADDSVMPQTVEAINHALAANVPIIVAINKVDKPDSNAERIRQQLGDKGILVEDWGGKYQSVEISAKFGKNLDVLMEKVLVEAELLELKANPARDARGVVLEAKLDKGKGVTATILVQKGSLSIGDTFVSGVYSGRVKAMFDEREHKLEVVGPSQAVQILGFDGMPQAGDTFVVLPSERQTKEIALKRQQLKREQDFRQLKLVTLDDISKQISEGKQVELKIILKADTDGSAEALTDSLQKLTTPEAKVMVIHKAIGQISESDILLAEASKAIIIGFNVRPNLNARKLAEKHQVDVRLYNIIYNVIDEVKLALEGMLAPEISENVTATVEVRDVFKVPKIGNIAGCYVQDGKITRNTKVRLIRDGFTIFSGGISSLRRLKDDVREVEQGYECGVGLENFNDIKVGDIIEGYEIVETKRKLTSPTA